MNWIEAIATIFGVIAVWLVVKRHIWCWPTGLVQVILYVGIFYQARLYSDMILHVIYIFMQLYGWYHWLHGDGSHHQIPVTNTGKAIWLWMAVTAAGTLVWGGMMANFTDASLPYPDAFTTAASLVAQWLTARKKLESWMFWIVVDIVAVFIYYYKELYFTTGLYLVFLVLATYGLLEWKKAMLVKPETEAL
jgi:nicotinamide mononucleotide transporter